MEFHRGRLIDHVHLRVSDLAASKKFYRAVLQALGKDHGIREAEHYFSADELWIEQADSKPSTVHLAFQASGPAAVGAFHAVALANGGRDNGAPGERKYHPGYYAAFALDPDGNNVEAVYHGPFEASAESVVLRPAFADSSAISTKAGAIHPQEFGAGPTAKAKAQLSFE